MTDLIGHTIGQYRIVEKIGKGGMATVYKAYQPALERYVAIKVMHEQLTADDEQFFKRFRREAKAVAALRHPNIVQVFDFGTQDDVPYMVMEYLEGTTLKAELNALAERGETMPLEEVQRIFRAVASALDHAHRQGMVHRDIKPANVMLTTKGDVILTDFGIARIVGGTQYTVTGAIVGTPTYISPEQGQGQRGDGRSDIYALGVMLYEMVTGQVPFEADTPLAVLQQHISAPLPLPRQLNPALPEAVERVILKALAKKPKRRYQTVAEMAGALEVALASEAVPVRERPPELTVVPPAPPRRAVPWVPIGLGLIGVGLLAVAIAIVAAGGIIPLVQRPTPPALTSTATVLVVLPTATPVPPTVYPTYTPYPTYTRLPTSTPSPFTPTATSTPTRAAPVPPTATPTAALTGKIAFTLWDGVKYNVWVANVDGSDRTMIIGEMRQPAFNLDGSKIAVNGEAHYRDNLHVADANGNNLIEVSKHLEDSRPSWSPDGSRIVFDSTSFGDTRSRIYILEDVSKQTEGHALRSVVGDTLGRDPFWLPDGRIVYRGCDFWVGNANCGLYIVPPDGSALPMQLTTDSNDIAPAARDNKVAFMSIRDGNWEIYSIHTDGSDLKRLTNNGVNDGLPTFSPSGQFIAFVSDEGGKWAIWAMNADGSGRRKLFDLDGSYGSGEEYDWITERISWAP